MKIYDGGVGPLAPDIQETVRQSNGFVLELGVFGGEGSTTIIQDELALHATPLHVSVDWSDQIAPEHRPAVKWWHFVKGDTREMSTLVKVHEVPVPHAAGVIFIDTDHNYEQMKAELALWKVLANDKTIWLFHDTQLWGKHNADMCRAIDEFAAAEGWQYDDLRTDSHGLGRLRR